MLGFLAQIAINIYVLRESLAKDHPHALQSNVRVASAGILLPFVGALGLIPAFAFIYGLDGQPVAYVGAIVAGTVTSFVAQSGFLAGMHRVRFGSALYLATKLWFVGAAIGVLGVVHPIIPFVLVCGFFAHKALQKRSLDQFSKIADTL